MAGKQHAIRGFPDVFECCGIVGPSEPLSRDARDTVNPRVSTHLLLKPQICYTGAVVNGPCSAVIAIGTQVAYASTR